MILLSIFCELCSFVGYQPPRRSDVVTINGIGLVFTPPAQYVFNRAECRALALLTAAESYGIIPQPCYNQHGKSGNTAGGGVYTSVASCLGFQNMQGVQSGFWSRDMAASAVKALRCPPGTVPRGRTVKRGVRAITQAEQAT